MVTKAREGTRARHNGHITVKVASLPGTSKIVEVPSDNPTVEQAIRAFGADPNNAGDVRVNNTPVSNLGAEVEEGNIVTMVGRVNGG